MQPETALSSGTLEAPKRKVWRVNLYAKELMDCGFFPEMIDPWNQVFKPLLIQKGLPEGFTLERTPVAITPFERNPDIEFASYGPGITLEFE